MIISSRLHFLTLLHQPPLHFNRIEPPTTESGRENFHINTITVKKNKSVRLAAAPVANLTDLFFSPFIFLIQLVLPSNHATSSTKGEGLCIYLHDNWCTNANIVDRRCSPDLEFLTVKCKLFYLPREITAVYIPPDADAKTAQSHLLHAIN